MKYSIVIPTYNHCDDLLKPCLESIRRNTDLNQTEVIVVANGCTDNTKQYVESLGAPFKLIWSDEALGYTRATNLGMQAAVGDYVVLLNNDTVIFDGPTNHWLNLLEGPFKKDPLVGITGPVKFNWNCGGATRTAMGFWLVMISRAVINHIGYLDEVFSPGMGEDGDYSIRLDMAGYKMVSVPENLTGEFDIGIVNPNFPIYHKGNGTFADNVESKNAVIDQNNQILAAKYGINSKQKHIEISIIIPTCNNFENAFKKCIDAVLACTDLSNKEIIVVANGSEEPTRNYLEQLKGKVSYLWFDERIGVIRAYNEGISRARGKYIVLLDDDSILYQQPTDTWINILKKPFTEDDRVGAASPFAHEYEDMGFIVHSGCTMYSAPLLRHIGMFDETYNPGYFSDPDVAMKIWQAGYKCVEVPQRQPNKLYENNMFKIDFPVIHTGEVQTMNKHKDIAIVQKNREILYSRYGKKKYNVKYSIVIPTYNHCEDLLKPCVESILRYTDMSNTEIIVVANGCVDNTREYVESLGSKAKLIWSDEAIGYTRATNMGIKQAQGEYIVLLNNDTELLAQPANCWLDMLVAPFADPTVGLTGPLQLYDNYAGSNVLIFFCVMVSRKCFDAIGILDEAFSPGGGEDIDFTVRANLAGFKSHVITETKYDSGIGTNVGNFPIWHKDNRTFRDIPEYTKHIVKRNGLINAKRYNKNIKLNLGAGGMTLPGYLSVDLHDPRALVQMDITKLDFDDNSVTEILASHVFEHLNPYHVFDILTDWLRVLKPGGKLIMEMPNIEEVCKQFVTANKQERYGLMNVIYGSVNTTGIGGPDNITSPHLFGWWPEALYDHMSGAGFRDIQFMPEQIPHPAANFRVEAIKPFPEVAPPPSVPVVESTPQPIPVVVEPVAANDTVMQEAENLVVMQPIEHTELQYVSIPPVNREWLKSLEPITFLEIFETNSYGVLKQEVENNTVIDIGANVGIFTLFCVEMGAARILSIEAQPVIFHQGLVLNVAQYPMVEPIHAAVYNTNDEIVLINNMHVGSKIVQEGGESTRTITLRKLLEDYQVEGNDLALKVDCEGSEFEIILSTDQDVLRRFKVIYMELHGGGCNPNYPDHTVVENKLRECGFELVKFMQQYDYPNGDPVPVPIYVQKWLRK